MVRTHFDKLAASTAAATATRYITSYVVFQARLVGLAAVSLVSGTRKLWSPPEGNVEIAVSFIQYCVHFLIALEPSCNFCEEKLNLIVFGRLFSFAKSNCLFHVLLIPLLR